ncbi:glycosyltransferase [Rhodopseudomonas palustris]|uniref:glycosyltransferase n=1 Tax=Rhodopseudomonas palustris TaxID=1076 RepID=UPI0020CC7CB9|nr:glycosyltransferase [Rhodopseudomonas palustris]MCP9627193.1 glycosyltransferase [Rhodopseudomonas palustris]
MRVLFNTYPWAFATPGGGEIQLLKYAEHLPALGVEVVLHDIWKPAFDRVSLVHFFGCLGGSIQFCGYAKSRSLPLVITSSLWITEETAHRYPMDEIRAQLSLADLVITNSNTESDTLARVFSLPRERFTAVMNGVEPRFAGPHDPALFRERFGIEGPFVLNVGNVEARKNQLGLLRAMAGHDLPVVVIGHIREPDYGRQMLAEGGDRLRYLGPLDHGDPLLASAYAACSAFVLPSTLETPGLAALEAAVAGAPLVVTSEGSTRDYFGDLAQYVRHDDPADIRRGIDAALAAGPGRELQSHILNNFSWSAVTATLVDVYRRVAGG